MTHESAMAELARCQAVTKPGCPVLIPQWVARVLLETAHLDNEKQTGENT